MKVVVDNKIPYIFPALDALGLEVVAMAGADIDPADVRDADILIVRTRTHVGSALLHGSSVRLVVTATIGYDHLDTTWLDAVGIEWHNCPGCNATSVAQYVETSLLALTEERGLRLDRSTLGIVGYGHVGTAVHEALKGKMRNILTCDIKAGDFCSLQDIAQQCDIISFHTPLTMDGPHPTWHLADKAFFDSLQHRPVIINAARGGVVDEQALLCAMDAGRVGAAIIDTWEHEPHPDPTLLRRAFIATPHIAGYSADGKANATRMCLKYVRKSLRIPGTEVDNPLFHPEQYLPVVAARTPLERYDPRRDSETLKQAPHMFEFLRGNYPLRREK